ncbi:hypothetical protein GH733_014779, partial [Mirounga leonina]
RKPYHKKQKYEQGCPTVNTKIGPCHIHTVHIWGANKKNHALRLDWYESCYALPLGHKKGAKLTSKEKEIKKKKKPQKIQNKYNERKKMPKSAVFQRSSASRASFLQASFQKQASVAKKMAICYRTRR